MDLAVLKKKISSYKTNTGKLTKVPDDLTIEILMAWEQWIGPANGFYIEIGVSSNKMARIIGRGKELRREGFGIEEFKEIKVEENIEESTITSTSSCSGIEVVWSEGKIIRFQNINLLVDFLKKAA